MRGGLSPSPPLDDTNYQGPFIIGKAESIGGLGQRPQQQRHQQRQHSVHGWLADTRKMRCLGRGQAGRPTPHGIERAVVRVMMTGREDDGNEKTDKEGTTD